MSENEGSTLDNYKKKNNELEVFTHLVAHNLKMPARTILSFSGILKKKIENKEHQDIQKYIEIIENTSANMVSLISSLLNYTNMDGLNLHFLPINPNHLIKEIMQEMQAMIVEKSAKIQVDDLPKTIVGDRISLKQLFQNILQNALLYIEPEESPNIIISYEHNDDHHIFHITDHGIGIEKEYIDQIFTIFKKLHSADVHSGHGIGLSICQKIVTYHNGTIKVQSTPHQGSTFTFSIHKDLKTHNIN